MRRRSCELSFDRTAGGGEASEQALGRFADAGI
jgi:hypothetical protein